MKLKISKSFSKSNPIHNFRKNINVFGKNEIKKNESRNIFLFTKDWTSVFIEEVLFVFSKEKCLNF